MNSALLLLLSLGVGDNAPDWGMNDLNGNWIQLSDLTRNGPVILSFWATWCKDCPDELDFLQTMYDKYKDQGLVVVSVSKDNPRVEAKVKSMINARGWTFPGVIDGKLEVYRSYGVYAPPSMVIIDKNGKVVLKEFGYDDSKKTKVENKIEETLN